MGYCTIFKYIYEKVLMTKFFFHYRVASRKSVSPKVDYRPESGSLRNLNLNWNTGKTERLWHTCSFVIQSCPCPNLKVLFPPSLLKISNPDHSINLLHLRRPRISPCPATLPAPIDPRLRNHSLRGPCPLLPSPHAFHHPLAASLAVSKSEDGRCSPLGGSWLGFPCRDGS